jgi:hypothetical protein
MDRKITMLSLFKFIQSDKGYVISILVCTLICELSTCVGRFGFKISLKEKEQVIKKLTLGIRIHHGYVGIGMILAAVVANAYVSSHSPWPSLLGVVGWGLLLSDTIHHFLVLYFMTGKTEFP